MRDIGEAPRQGSLSTSIAQRLQLNRAVLRCRECDIDDVSIRLGITLPRSACSSAQDGLLDALWLGPDEWLLLSQDPGANWFDLQRAKLDGVCCSLVDIGHRNVGFHVSGENVEAMFSTGCPLDLSMRSFPVGMCTRTVFHKAEIILWRRDICSFHVEIGRSFEQYLEALLSCAADEF